jgi:hypothetical protein
MKRLSSPLAAVLFLIAGNLVVGVTSVRADILIEDFDNHDPELAISFTNPGNTITSGPTNWTIDLRTATQPDYFGYARSLITDIAPDDEGYIDISSETTLEFDFALNGAGSYGTEVFVVIEDFWGGVNVYKSAFGLGNHLYKTALASPTFTAGSGPADLADVYAIQIQANSFAPPPGGGPGAVSAPYSISFNELRATSPIPANPSVVTDFNNVGVFPGYESWANATITTGPNSLRVVSSGFGGSAGQAFSTLDAAGKTHAEVDVTINDSDSPVNIVALLEDADGTQNVWRWYGLTGTNGEGGTSNHLLSFRMDTVTSEGAFDETPTLIDNATSWQTVYLDNTPGDLTDNTSLDLANIVNFHIQVDPQSAAPNNSYDVSFNNFRVVDAPGSFDTDYDVDGRDFLLWQRGLSPSGLSSGDLAEWRAAYGAALVGLQAVPEPTSGCLLLISVLAGVGIRRSSAR